MIERLNQRDVSEVAELHAVCLKDGFLSSLGSSFLKHLYGAMAVSEKSFCLVAKRDNRVVGFISGTSSTSQFYAEFFRRNAFPAAVAIFPKLFHRGVLRKIIETLRYPSVGLPDVPGAELLSIAVNKNFRTMGIGKSLFSGLVVEFGRLDINEFRIVVGSELTAANHFYSQVGARFVAQIEMHKKSTSKIYVWGSE